MDWSLRDAIFSRRLFRTYYDNSFVWEWEIYMCFNIRGGDARVTAPSRTWGVEGFLERSLMCWVITGLGCVSHFGTNEI